MQVTKLASAVRGGDRAAIAKAISLAEDDPDSAGALMRALMPPRKAFVIGVTGAPGTGKSTLVGRLIESYRRSGLKVGVVAVDPSSPITGGALLGDRIRMKAYSADEGVFIRSMASRGWSGGLSRAASDALQVLDSAGFEVTILETAGIGQADIEVVGIAHAVLVVLMPGMGDDVQASKAGLMEVGDVYVVNKSDLGGAGQMVSSLFAMLRGSKGRSPAVLTVSALKGEGIDRLMQATEAIRSRLDDGSEELKLRSIRGMVIEAAKAEAMRRVETSSVSKADVLAKLVLDGKVSVAEAAARLVR